jgi:hypothetical protein
MGVNIPIILGRLVIVMLYPYNLFKFEFLISIFGYLKKMRKKLRKKMRKIY